MSKKFYLLVEKDQLPICNQICTGAPSLRVDESIRRSLPSHALNAVRGLSWKEKIKKFLGRR